MAIRHKGVTKSTKPRKTKPKTHAGKTWTKARYFQFIRSALRQSFQRYPVKQQFLVANRRDVKGKRHKHEYQCEECQDWFMRKEVAVDHINPAGSLNDYKDLPGFVKRLYCEADNLQVLCNPCHKIKTAKERKERKK